MKNMRFVQANDLTYIDVCYTQEKILEMFMQGFTISRLSEYVRYERKFTKAKAREYVEQIIYRFYMEA